MNNPEKIFAHANIDSKLCLFCHPNNGMSLCETENYRVLRCNFPASIGHIMLSSKVHYGSLGEIEKKFIPELESLKKQLSEWYSFQKSHVIYYEHGRAGSCHTRDDGDAQCEHFHLNSLASNICIHKDLKKLFGKGIAVSSLSEFSELFIDWGEYLFFENSLGEGIYYPVSGKAVPPHLLRTLLCQSMGAEERSNWMTHQNYEEFLENYRFTQSFPKYMRSLQNALSRSR